MRRAGANVCEKNLEIKVVQRSGFSLPFFPLSSPGCLGKCSPFWDLLTWMIEHASRLLDTMLFCFHGSCVCGDVHYNIKMWTSGSAECCTIVEVSVKKKTFTVEMNSCDMFNSKGNMFHNQSETGATMGHKNQHKR